HDVRLGQLDAVATLLAVHENALVVVVDCNRQLLLGLFLPDHILVQERLYLLGLGKLVRSGGLRGRGSVILEDRVADRHALVANVGPWVVAGRRDQFRYRVLRLVAERAPQDLICTRPVFHSAVLLLSPGIARPEAPFARSVSKSLSRRDLQ